MRRTLCALMLAVCTLGWAMTGEAADNDRPQPDGTEPKDIGSEDREVIRRMELLALMDLLKDMELLEGGIKTPSEDEQ